MKNSEKAILLMLLSTLSFAIMGAAVKFLQDVPVTEKVFVRNLISLFVAFLLARRSSMKLFGSSAKGRLLLLSRSFFGLSGVVLIFYSIGHLTLADSALFMRLSPFWVAIFAALFLSEKLTKNKVLLLIMAFIGAIVVIRPQFNISTLPAFAALLASLSAGAAYTLVSKLKSYEKPETIVFFFSFFSVVVMIPFVFVHRYIPTTIELLGLIITGLGAAGGQITLTYAYRFGKASEISIYNYLGIIFSSIIGYVLWLEIPDIFTIIGAFIIFGSGFLMFLLTKKRVEDETHSGNR
jgi:drug/metabolite transporter (DMT)-like permease